MMGKRGLLDEHVTTATRAQRKNISGCSPKLAFIHGNSGTKSIQQSLHENIICIHSPGLQHLEAITIITVQLTDRLSSASSPIHKSRRAWKIFKTTSLVQ